MEELFYRSEIGVVLTSLPTSVRRIHVLVT